MPIVPLDFDLQSNPGRYGHDGGGRIINGYTEEAGAKAKTQFPIYAAEGLASFSTLTGGGRVRGAIELNGYGYVVSGTALYKVDSDGNVILNVGSFPGAGPVFMAKNRKATPQIMLVSDGLRYICESDVLTSIADTDLGAANSVGFLGGWFVATKINGQFQISGIDEGTTWDALDFATAEAKADDLLVVYPRGRELVLFGSESIEFWPLTGNADFPFESMGAALINNLGCLCRHSVRDLNDVIFLVASDGTVRRLNNYSPERISTHVVERNIATVANKDDITATAYSWRGHQFYILSCDDWTLVYDGLTGLWTERRSYQENRWRGEVTVNIEGKQCIGDFESGLLYQLSDTTYDEAGAHLIWTVQARTHAYPHRFIVNRLFLDLIPGTGLNSLNEHVADPKVMLRVSKNGGKTWGNEKSKSVGRIGQFSKRVVFDRLGETREDGMDFEISMSAAVIRAITGAAVDVEPCEP